jgi:hypothetical protein
MSAPRPEAPKPIPRLLVVSDAALADAGQLPDSVRALIDSAAELYVVTPSLPGRISWIADDVDRSRHIAEERLAAVLRNMRSIGARVSGRIGDDTALTAVGDAVMEFQPDHILLALRGHEHASWQEKGLIQRIRDRFSLPLTTYAVDPQGRG